MIDKRASLIPILFLLYFVAAYPGAVTPDSVGQFQQGLAFSFESHHPPVMSILWSFFSYYIYKGPQTMLFFHFLLLWSGIALLYFSDKNNKYRILYLLLPFIPNILIQSSYIWKDVGFSISIFFVISASVFAIYRYKNPSLRLFLIALVILFYGVSVKFQGKFIVPFCIFFMSMAILKTKAVANLIITLILSIGVISLNQHIIDKYSINTESWQLRELFDMASIAKDINDDSFFPEYIKKYENYNFESLKEKFTHKWVDPLIFPEERIYVSTQDENNLRQLNQAFYGIIKQYPHLYLKHRIINFCMLLKSSAPVSEYALINKKELDQMGVKYPEENNYITKFFVKIISIYPKFLNMNVISLFIILVYSINLFWKRNDKDSTEKSILKIIVIITMVFTLVLFFATMASDHRYYFLVRLLSFMYIPIYLQYITQNSDDHKKI